jgi:hypothetical protein
MMVKLDLSSHNQENYNLSLMMLISKELLLWLPLLIVKELFQEVMKEKLESGKLVNKLKLCKLP